MTKAEPAGVAHREHPQPGGDERFARRSTRRRSRRSTSTSPRRRSGLGPCSPRRRRTRAAPLLCGSGDTGAVGNAQIADRLDAFASLLELREANPYTVRASRRAAETIRGASVPVNELVRSGRVRALRGIGGGIEARLRELVETGTIAELVELEREFAPDLVGLGRYLGLSAKRSVELARALDVGTADELREAAADGGLRGVPGIGAKTEARRPAGGPGGRREAGAGGAGGAAPRGRPTTTAGTAAQPRLGARRWRGGRP